MAGFIKNIIGGVPKGGSQSSKEKVLGRVQDVILNEDHPFFEEKGSYKALNGIFYIQQGRGLEQQEDRGQLPFAYPNSPYTSTPPIPGELVEIEIHKTPGETGLEDTRYYTAPLNLWNATSSNIYKDVFTGLDLDETLEGVYTPSNITPKTKTSAGDIIIHGRRGQSLKFTSARDINTPWEQQEQGSLTILKNSSKGEENGFIPVFEDINNDISSIYLSENQTLGLIVSSKVYNSYKQAPKSIQNYNLSQINLTSGRLVLNSSEDDVLVSSKNSVGLNGGISINLDAKKYIGLDAEKILIGSQAVKARDNEKQPVLLGHKTEKFLEEILDLLEGLAVDMQTAATIDGKPIPLLNKRAGQILAKVSGLKTRVNSKGSSTLKSKKVFTE